MKRRALFLAIFACATGTLARAHPIHTSLAEADFRPESGRLEIALRLFSDDAEAALSARAGKRVWLATTPAATLDPLLLALVRASFTVKPQAGAMPPLTLLGHELKDGDQHLWLYLVCSLPGGLDGAKISDRMLRELFSDQVNSIRLRDRSVTPVRQTTLVFADDREQTVAFR